MNRIEGAEFEWYLRDHLFRQYSKGKRQFKKEALPAEMINLYLRYRNSEVQKISLMVNDVLDRLRSESVIMQLQNGSIKLACALNRVQCSKCYYVSYLSDNEPRKCTRCFAEELHGFPKGK
jgi:hypothetical protein